MSSEVMTNGATTKTKSKIILKTAAVPEIKRGRLELPNPLKTQENKIKLLEINYCPGFMVFSKASSIDVADKIIDYCLKRYKNSKK